MNDRMGYKKYMKRENPASLTKSLQEVNSEGQYLHVQARGFWDKKFFTLKNAPVSPSELRQRLGLSHKSLQLVNDMLGKYIKYRFKLAFVIIKFEITTYFQ